MLCAQKRSPNIYPEDLVPVLSRNLPERHDRSLHSRVGEENGNRLAEVVLDPLPGLLHLVALADVARISARVASIGLDPCCGVGGGIAVDVDAGHAGALRRKSVRHGVADARARARHYTNVIRKPHESLL